MRTPTIFAMILCFSLQSFAKEEFTIEQYIDAYAALAVSEMKSSNIPASVTLAQGILESHFGNSYLAREANNHFGIKCHSSWTGKRVYRDDDKKNECFRKYGHPVQSFRDHSTFLQAPRYAFLFDLNQSDYIGWCYGLKEAGYATDKKYPARLIDLIERYQLTKYDGLDQVVATNDIESLSASTETADELDTYEKPSAVSTTETRASRGVSVNSGNNPKYTSRNSKRSKWFKWLGKNRSETTAIRPEPGMKTRVKQSETFYFNNIKTVVVTEECTPMQIARTYNISLNRLCDYNEFESNTVIPAQTKVFLQPKRNMGPVTDETIRVQDGQTMEIISQYYGIKLKSLYKRNKMRVGTQPAVGEVIYLRGKNPRVPKTVVRESLAITNNRFIQTPGERSNTGDMEITNPTSYKIPEPKSESTANSNNNWSKESSNTSYTNRTSTTTTAASTEMIDVSEPTRTSSTTTNSPPDGIIVGSFDDEPTIVNGRVVTTRSSTPSRIVTGSLDDPAPSRITYDEPRTGKIVLDEERNARIVLDDEPASDRVELYQVKSGDTLWGISKRFNVSVERIKTASNITSNALAIGQTLRIPIQ